MPASIPLTVTSKRETSNEFRVAALQTIASTNKATTIAYREADLKAGFAYQSVPLKANETKEIILKYSVRYPKDKKVLVE